MSSPACEATTLTVPVPVKVSRAPVPSRTAGPAATAKLTGSPLDVLAAKSTCPVVHCVPGFGNAITWSAFSTTRMASAEPSYSSSTTSAATQ